MGVRYGRFGSSAVAHQPAAAIQRASAAGRRLDPTLLLALCLILAILAGCSPPGPEIVAPAAAPVQPASTVPPPLPASTVAPTEPPFTSAVQATDGAAAAEGGLRGERMAALVKGNPFQTAAAAQVADDNALLALFPELRTAPAPAWLAEGVRVTYYIQSAGPVQKDPDDSTSFGAGFMQYDLVAVQGGATRAAWKFYLAGSGGSLTPSGVGVSRGIPGAGEYWVQPAVLRDAERVANDELVVGHMPTTISGRSYQAVRFEYRPAGATYVWVFDAASGVLLFYRHVIGPEDDPRQTAQMIFQARRTPNVPWRAGAAPAWARRNVLRYVGEVTVLTFGAPTATFPLAVEARPQGGSTRHVEYTVSDYTSGRLSNQAARATGAGQLFDGFWLPQAALGAALRRGVLDDDPVTGARVTVAPGAGGAIVLTEAGQSYSTVLTYDGRTGALESLAQETTAGAITTRITLGRRE